MLLDELAMSRHHLALGTPRRCPCLAFVLPSDGLHVTNELLPTHRMVSLLYGGQAAAVEMAAYRPRLVSSRPSVRGTHTTVDRRTVEVESQNAAPAPYLQGLTACRESPSGHDDVPGWLHLLTKNYGEFN